MKNIKTVHVLGLITVVELLATDHNTSIALWMFYGAYKAFKWFASIDY